MKKIAIAVHYPDNRTAIDFIHAVTTETYLKAVEKLLRNSDLDKQQKRQILDHLIANRKAAKSKD